MRVREKKGEGEGEGERRTGGEKRVWEERGERKGQNKVGNWLKKF